MIYGPQYGRSYCPVDPSRVPGQVPLPYVTGGRRTLIAVFVLTFHAALIIVPMVFMAVTDMLNPPVYVMRLPTVDSIPSEKPSPHPSPLNKTSTGTPDRGKPLTDIPEIPDLVKPVEPPKPQPKVQPKPEPVQTKEKPPEPVPDTRKTIPVKNVPKQKPKPKNTLLSADQIKVSTKRVKNPARTSTPTPRQNQVSAADRARAAQRAEAVRALRSMTGETGGTGTPGGGGGPRGIVSKEVSDYYSKVEAFLKRQWQQPSLYNNEQLKVVVLLQVDKSGRVLQARIQKRSGVAAMDSSVEQLIRSLRVLPAPPQTMQFDVTMEIDR